MAFSQTDRIMGELRVMQERAVIEISRETTVQLARANPKDTTFSSKNWIPRPYAPFQGTDGVYDASKFGSQVSDQEQRNGLRAMSGYSLGVGNKAYITNNADYIEGLNAGSSRKAPKRFVQRSMERGVINAVAKVKQP